MKRIRFDTASARREQCSRKNILQRFLNPELAKCLEIWDNVLVSRNLTKNKYALPRKTKHPSGTVPDDAAA